MTVLDKPLEFINCKVCGKLVRKKSEKHILCFSCMMEQNEKYNEVLRGHAERNKLLFASKNNYGKD